MAGTIPWRRTLTAKLGGIALAMLALSLLLVIGNLVALASIKGDAAWINLSGGNRVLYAQMVHRANRLADAKADAQRKPMRDDLDRLIAELEKRTDLLLRGDPATGAPAPTDLRIIDSIQERQRIWNEEIKPILVRLAAEGSAREAAQGDLERLETLINRQIDLVSKGNDSARQVQQQTIDRAQVAQYVFAGVVAVVIGAILWIARGIGRRARSLVATTEHITAGDLTRSASVGGSDELAVLGESFNAMTANLRTNIEAEKAGRAQIETHLETEKKNRSRIEALLESIRAAVSRLTASATELLATTAQQTAGAQQQAASVAQTVASVDQITQTASQAAQRAKGVGEVAQRNLEIGQAGRKTVEDSIASLDRLKEQVESTAQTILTLAEQAQAIGEIIATVNDIAEQTNLLALNAAIEASRAGEHGRGFAVVAEEVKALADQSKKATTQVRQILGEIQKATNTAVLSTEEVTKGVATAIKAGGQSGQTIHALSEALADAARAAAQIAASAGQQSTGMNQISQAMRDLDQVAKQNLAATRQAEQTAQDLNALGTELAGLATS